jgi:hypothetical protein
MNRTAMEFNFHSVPAQRQPTNGKRVGNDKTVALADYSGHPTGAPAVRPLRCSTTQIMRPDHEPRRASEVARKTCSSFQRKIARIRK